MVTPEEAREIVLGRVNSLPVSEVDILDSLGYVLAEEVVSNIDLPSFNNSAMDGYAVLVQDTRGASSENPIGLKVVDSIPAGTVSKKVVRSGTVMEIMTGAQVPEGADAVVQVEDTKIQGETVYILREARVNQNIRPIGESVNNGETVLKAGCLIRPAEVGILASLGMSKVKVFQRPRVAVLTTGDELVEVDEPLEPGKIRNSNSYFLYAQVLACGAEPIRLGIVRDNKKEMRSRIEEGLKIADLVLTTGGVSVGEYDVVKDVLAEMGANLRFWKVAQKPGKPLAFWTLNGKLVFGLPGNPVAAMVSFEEYVRPALLKMMGKINLDRPEITAYLTQELKKRPGRVHFIRVKVENRDGRYYAASTGAQGSGILKSMVLANGLAVIPDEAENLKPGDPIKVQLIDLPEDH